MKKTRFTEEQTVTILREADEKSVPEVAKKHGVSATSSAGVGAGWCCDGPPPPSSKPSEGFAD